MTKIRITKSFRFEMAHALAGYDGLCKHIHGHSYELLVTVKGEPLADPTSPKLGMVMDFGDLKRLIKRLVIDRFDHALVINETSRDLIPSDSSGLFGKVVVVSWQPSSENFLLHFSQNIKNELPPQVELIHLLLRETATSYAEWFAEDNR